MCAEWRCENLSFRYGDGRWITDDLNITFTEGVTAVMGPSGCGKSTLSKLLLGLAAPSSGTVARSEPGSVSMVMQDPVLLPWYTVERHGMVVCRAAKRAHVACVWKNILKEYGLSDAIHAYPCELSGGMRQRLALALVEYLSPRYVVLDEPVSALDIDRKQFAKRKVAALASRESAVVVVIAHSPEDVSGIAHQVVILDGPPIRVLAQKKLCPEKMTVEKIYGLYTKACAHSAYDE